MFDNFFERLSLDFIPKIEIKNNTIDFNNSNNKYISKKEIKLIIDKEDYFNKREFNVEFNKLITHKHIKNKELWESSYFIFFSEFDKTIDNNEIKILIKCFTETNPNFDSAKSISTQLKLNRILKKYKITQEFIVLNYYLSSYSVLLKARNKLAYLLSEYFNKIENMQIETVKNYFYGRSSLNSDSEIIKKIINHLKINN